jgi:hypothetical protein
VETLIGGRTGKGFQGPEVGRDCVFFFSHVLVDSICKKMQTK